MRHKRAEEHFAQHPGIEKCLVLFAGLRTVSRMAREDLARNLLRHLECEAEMLRGLRKQLLPELRSGKLIEREIAADRREGLGIFAQALLLEDAAGKFT